MSKLSCCLENLENRALLAGASSDDHSHHDHEFFKLDKSWNDCFEGIGRWNVQKCTVGDLYALLGMSIIEGFTNQALNTLADDGTNLNALNFAYNAIGLMGVNNPWVTAGYLLTDATMTYANLGIAQENLEAAKGTHNEGAAKVSVFVGKSFLAADSVAFIKLPLSAESFVSRTGGVVVSTLATVSFAAGFTDNTSAAYHSYHFTKVAQNALQYEQLDPIVRDFAKVVYAHQTSLEENLLPIAQGVAKLTSGVLGFVGTVSMFSNPTNPPSGFSAKVAMLLGTGGWLINQHLPHWACTYTGYFCPSAELPAADEPVNAFLRQLQAETLTPSNYHPATDLLEQLAGKATADITSYIPSWMYLSIQTLTPSNDSPAAHLLKQLADYTPSWMRYNINPDEVAQMKKEGPAASQLLKDRLHLRA